MLTPSGTIRSGHSIVPVLNPYVTLTLTLAPNMRSITTVLNYADVVAEMGLATLLNVLRQAHSLP